MKKAKPALLDVFSAIGSAHAGESLTPEQLQRRLLGDGAPEGDKRAADLRARFNGPAPSVISFPDEQTAALAIDFENAGKYTALTPYPDAAVDSRVVVKLANGWTGCGQVLKVYKNGARRVRDEMTGRATNRSPSDLYQTVEKERSR